MFTVLRLVAEQALKGYGLDWKLSSSTLKRLVRQLELSFRRRSMPDVVASATEQQLKHGVNNGAGVPHRIV